MCTLAKVLKNDKFDTNKDKFTVLKTDITSPEKFWDGLDYNKKVDVGSAALHQGYITPNTRFNCGETKFVDLSKKQQKVITNTIKTKDETYTNIGLRILANSLFKAL